MIMKQRLFYEFHKIAVFLLKIFRFIERKFLELISMINMEVRNGTIKE